MQTPCFLTGFVSDLRIGGAVANVASALGSIGVAYSSGLLHGCRQARMRYETMLDRARDKVGPGFERELAKAKAAIEEARVQ